MIFNYYLKTGETNLPLRETLSDANGIVDVSGATITFIMRPIQSEVAKINAAASIVNGPLGQVRYDWVAADVDTLGTFYAEWKVTFSNGKITKFPNDGHIVIEITGSVV